jgi:hypothetical protein
MKKLTNRVKELVLLDNVKAFLLLRFENSNKNMTTLPYDITEIEWLNKLKFAKTCSIITTTYIKKTPRLKIDIN